MSGNTASSEVNKTAHEFDKTNLDSLLSRRFFFAPAFEIYGGVAGLYDYGPTGSALQANILDAWRKHYIIEEDMLELDTTIMTLSDVLKTSGHVDKFADWMVKDKVNGEIFRADHLVEAVLEARLKGDKEARGKKVEEKEETDEKKKKKKKNVKSEAVKLDDKVVEEFEYILAQIDNYTGPQLGELIKKWDIRSPANNELSEPVEFNLMFQSDIGPTGQIKGYLRPETAQGHFVNFARLLEFNNGKVPFASAQIGKSFRNEIAPRQGLLRVREFTMAEIEHYVDPLDKRHARFNEVRDVVLALLPKDVQQEGRTELTRMTVGDAVEKGIVDNETLGYFLGRTQLFLTKIGIDAARLRCRQHMANEMAHYAADCWDFEIQSSYGWIECVGCADRSAYDLTVHAAKTKQPLRVQQRLDQPRTVEKLDVQYDAKAFGIKFKKDAATIKSTLAESDKERLQCIKDEMDKDGKSLVKCADGKEYELTPDLVKINPITVTEHMREFTPNVIEPSFGIGRILYSLLEHSYWAREQDKARGVLSFPPLVAPIKVLIVAISNDPALTAVIHDISIKLRKLGIASRVDDSSASIGKKYARNDELGTPFGITVDFATAKNGTLTLRERDTTKQLIGSTEDVLKTVDQLVKGTIDWEGASKVLQEYSGVQDVE
ncbi:glycine-tRNA ligase [Trichosporon asahii var. asahii CBS 8904]|uniref:glycine--tRNA ligase n=2 Tax=Trichosporon asahii var. asahii TaxID=189963 RepID=K1VFJ9_TRIAC|nr:glycine-tRNA ligase [Trichosporon asahii var. asahii CBS 2479]EJT51731.1 glycine-tRNA ligase [Trichosporon asahii var. asahii CBS 2479]EKD02860.1 glycine-tRNA ligase [Trichosporon asahii var. asahii CBS 8904]